jgi:preprotein translocase subunit YajC
LNPVDFIPILLIGAIMYFLLIRPQMQEKAEHDKLLESLARDDRVVMGNGIHGKVVSVADDTVVLEISEKARVTVDKRSVARRATESAKA